MESLSDIQEILNREKIITHFHPIVSLKEQSVVGYEALSRGIDPESGEIVSPLDLISSACEHGLSLELDRLFRKRAVESFCGHDRFRDPLLFLNVDASVLTPSSVGSGRLADLVKSAGVLPERVAIELVESRVENAKSLQDFAAKYRKAGFLIAIDDFGTEHSNFERLIRVRPDVIKIDRSIISGIERDYYKQSVFKSVVELAKMIGALSLAEGVETIEELQVCAQYGTDLFQGFYFSMPGADIPALFKSTGEAIDAALCSLNDFFSRMIRSKNVENLAINAITQELIEPLSRKALGETEDLFRDFLFRYQEVECIYLIDEKGCQLTGTVCSPSFPATNRHSLFQPALKNTDHSSKNYYYYIKNLDARRYLTDPYLSLATGRLCRTMAVIVNTRDITNGILCIDFRNTLQS